MASTEDSTSSSEDAAETTLNEDLLRGSEQDVIEYYFYRGLTYRHIRSSSNAVLHMSRIEFNELSSCVVRHMNQFDLTD